MPNWVYNSVVVSGTEEKLKKFKEKHFKEEKEGILDFDFETIIPMPNYVFKGDLGQKEKEIYGSNNWYDWSCDNWGTKWNACHTEFYAQNPIRKNGNQSVLEFKFDTAWGLPEPIYDKLAEMYPDLHISVSYDEEGMFFAGDLEILNGEVTNIPRDPEASIDEDYEEMEE